MYNWRFEERTEQSWYVESAPAAVLDPRGDSSSMSLSQMPQMPSKRLNRDVRRERPSAQARKE